METYTKKYNDTVTMAKRCLLFSKRNPDTLLTSIMLPALMMILFVSLFGKLISVGDISYVNYILPGVLLQCIGQCSSVTAIMINKDMTSGIVDRFCTLPIKKSAILNGHILEAFIRSSVTSVVVLLVALLMGFRPSIGSAGLCVFLILLFSSILTLSYAAMVVGIAASSAEGASALSAFVIILPYLSSGFVPIDTLPKIMRVFAEHQPMTPIINTMRNVLLGKNCELDTFMIALIWCIGLSIIFYFASVILFKKRTHK